MTKKLIKKVRNLKTFMRSNRKRRIRKKIFGTPEKPRLAVHKSLKNLKAQLIDDIGLKTLLSVSSTNKDFKAQQAYAGNVKASEKLGELFAKKAAEKGFKEVVFDRGGYKYHGRIKAFAESVRKNGIKF